MLHAAKTNEPSRVSEHLSTPYVFVCPLSEGGMGVVELALREEGPFRRLYAVKRLQPQFRNDAEFRAMFVDEARIAGLIRHPNVVSVLDVGEDERGPFLVMDFVDGIPLSTLIASRPRGERIPVQVALRLGFQAAKGLHAAHELRDHDGTSLELVHRDVSPQNMLLGFDGELRLTDFGIAKALGRSTRTNTGVLKGKFGYMAPEQLQFLEPDRRTDLFALGVVIYELLSGVRLYRNEQSRDGARRILTEPPPDIADVRTDVPAEVVELLFSLLAKDPEARPPNASEVAGVLEEAHGELVALLGLLDTSAYLAATYPGLQEQRQQDIERSLADASQRDEPLYAIGERSVSANTRIQRRDARSGTMRTLLIALVTGCAFAAAAWIVARATFDHGLETDETTPSAPTAPIEELAERATAEPVEQPVGRPVEAVLDENVVGTAAAQPAVSERPATRRRRRTRAARDAREPPPSANPSPDELRTFRWDDH